MGLLTGSWIEIVKASTLAYRGKGKGKGAERGGGGGNDQIYEGSGRKSHTCVGGGALTEAPSEATAAAISW